jgi:hypothetical protein
MLQILIQEAIIMMHVTTQKQTCPTNQIYSYIPSLRKVPVETTNVGDGLSDNFKKIGKIISQETILTEAKNIELFLKSENLGAAKAELNTLQQQYDILTSQIDDYKSRQSNVELYQLKMIRVQIESFLTVYGSKIEGLERNQEVSAGQLDASGTISSEISEKSSLEQLVDRVFEKYQDYDGTFNEPKWKTERTVIYAFAVPKKTVRMVSIFGTQENCYTYEKLSKETVLEKFGNKESLILAPFRWSADRSDLQNTRWNLSYDDRDNILWNRSYILIKNEEDLKKFIEDNL